MSESNVKTTYFKPIAIADEPMRKWHIVNADLQTTSCRNQPMRKSRFELTDEEPPEGALCHLCRTRVDEPYRQAKLQAFREKYLVEQLQMKANREAYEERERQRNQVYSTIEEFGQLPIESQLSMQMLRTIAWIRGYKAYWVVGTAKDEFGINLTIDLVQEIGNEMPTQALLDRANEYIKNYFQQKIQNER